MALSPTYHLRVSSVSSSSEPSNIASFISSVGWNLHPRRSSPVYILDKFLKIQKLCFIVTSQPDTDSNLSGSDISLFFSGIISSAPAYSLRLRRNLFFSSSPIQIEEEDLNMENVYYSEMKDAGFFDPDWE
ncbi:hypothetical protein F2Q68_00015388 [Brassica cretica]|uniref:Uncharacterized protein n=2 Tax=Brassica cretica TaxID=69181 RepID=A0A8S9HFN2_BRACR|nr:hypothetical protein F2Q68_00015388 [Brassica cretica]KAF3605143.1 hypothetical protein DY000_02048029 [Brassica cretica]